MGSYKDTIAIVVVVAVVASAVKFLFFGRR